jgi:Protein of unknown function (DUF2934)
MSSKPKKTESIESELVGTDTGDASVGNSARDEEIRRRAYESYLDRDGQPGGELDDWLQAERELDAG